MTMASSVFSRPPRLCGEDSLSPLVVWTAIKNVLRRELGEREWEMWIQHARLWRVMSGNTMGVLVPRNGRACFGILRHKKRVRALASRMGFAVVITVQEDMEYREMKRAAIEETDRGPDFPHCHKHARRLLAKWKEEQVWLTQPFLEPPCSDLWSDDSPQSRGDEAGSGEEKQ